MEFPIRRFYNIKSATREIKKDSHYSKAKLARKAHKLYTKSTKQYLKQVERFKRSNPKEYAVIYDKYIKPVDKPSADKQLTNLKKESKRLLKLHKQYYKQLKRFFKSLSR